jgi:hypothetical protein
MNVGWEFLPESILFLSHMGDLDGVGIFVSTYLLADCWTIRDEQ